ncbi:hypothetical protein AZE42_02598 [Rhizopogon vesiculosus]|uniref:Uncharacterized protein n=1 Tax=Rhizopogon vesiculosus TaxID=180088 RepID=A0A1J8Q632_9AGAM|nr:hypothetical protein AZE42_02598 [Rhizopogon vesiculosus]
MPSWTLPGRKDAPNMRYKAILETSFAFSYTFNPRNLEYHWYPLWNQTLSDMVSDVPNVIVAPQYPIWFVPQDDEDGDEDERDKDDDMEYEDDGSGGDPEEIHIMSGESLSKESTVLEADNMGEDVAEVSFALTVPEKDARGVIVDFSVINLSGVPLKQPGGKMRYGGWRITAANIGLLVEVKSFVSRSLTSAELEKAIRARITAACDDLIRQAAYLFLQDPNKDSVLAIAAVGQWWCNTKINRGDVNHIMQLLAAKDPLFQINFGPAVVPLKWTKVLRLGVAPSNDRLRTIYNSLKSIGVLETPVDV